MAPRNLAFGIVFSLGLHAALAAALLLLPPPSEPDATATSIVPLRLMASRQAPHPAPATPRVESRPSDSAGNSPHGPAGDSWSARAGRPPRPQPRDRILPPRATSPDLDGDARLSAAAVGDAPADAAPTDGHETPDPTASGIDGPEQAEGSGAGGARGGVAGTAPQAEEGLERQRVAYALDVRRSLESIGRYPTVARRLGLAGRVVLRVRIDNAGRVADSSVDTPSDHPELDDAALASTRRLQALTPPPGGAIDVVVPVVFTMRSR